MSARFRGLLALASVLAIGCHPPNRFTNPTPGPKGVVETPADSRDGSSVYRAVLDSLYSFHDTHPRMVVISGQYAINPSGLPPHDSRVDSSTVAAYNSLTSIADGMNPTFGYRVPIAVLSSESMQALERDGLPLQREAILHGFSEEPTGFWLAFRNQYPGAWGYVELSRIAYNPDHTQALVYSIHRCGTVCESGETWLMRREGEKWSIAERMSRYEVANWGLDSLRYLGRSADPKWYQPRRARGVVSNAETGAVLPFLDITFAGGSFLRTVRTDSAGSYTVEGLPLMGDAIFRVHCPIPGRADTVAGPYLMSHAGIDTTINVEVRYRGCTHLNRADPLIAGAPRASAQVDSSRLPPEIAGVYRGVLDALHPPGVPERGAIMLEGFTSRRCRFCIEPEVPRLIRKGLIDPSTDANFAKVRADTAPPALFSYRRKVQVMPPWDLYWLGGSTGRQWDAMKDAYPGVNAVISFAGVGFNDRRTEALVEFHADSAGSADGSETMLLRKTGLEWRVALRHVEREATSGEWSGDKCEAGDAPTQTPTRAEIEKIAGVFSVVRVGASRAFRGRTDTLRLRLEPLKSSPSSPKELVTNASVLDATGEPDKKIVVKFNRAPGAGTIAFTEWLPEGMTRLDGWYEEYKILGTNGRVFVGTWLTETGPTIPWRGYFCARPALARR